MSLGRFLSGLFESGRVVVEPALELESGPEVEQLLTTAESVVAMNLAGKAPPLDLAVAKWAARLFYQGCQFVACRDIGPEVIEKAFQERCPAEHSPSTDYSADLVFQYLPDLINMTRGLAPGDPLLEHLLKLAREWPLSSVGIAEVGPVEVKGFIEHSSLRQLYVDRIITRVDKSRLGEPLVDRAVRESLGAFPALCQSLADALLPSGPTDLPKTS